MNRFELKLPPSLLQAIDAWRRQQEDLPNRSEAIRRLLAIGLRTNSSLKPTILRKTSPSH
jgi:metal-responsive CopG/Arc/MetJ family transcriptional regulator